jgi:hypothetical protein
MVAWKGGEQMKSFRVIGVLLVVVAGVVLAGVALAGKASTPAHPRQTRGMQAATTVSKAARPHSYATGRTESERSTGSPHTDVQSGDQATPDSQHEQSSGSASESGSDTETAQSGEPAQGHEDPPGLDVSHECTATCQE